MATYRQQCIRLALQRVLAAHLSQDEARITPVCSTGRCAVLCCAVLQVVEWGYINTT